MRGAFRLLGRAPAQRFQKRLHRPRRPAHGPPHDMCRRSPSFGEVFRRHCGRLSVFWVGLLPSASKRGFIRPRRPAHGPPHDMCRRSPSFGEVFRRHCGRLSVFWVGLPPCASKRGFIDPDVQPTDLRTICVGGLHRSVRFSVVIAQGFPSFGSGSRLCFRLHTTQTSSPRTSARLCRRSPSFGEVFRRHWGGFPSFGSGARLALPKEASYDPDVQPTDLRTICVGGLHRSVRFSVVIAGGFPSFGSGARLALPKEASYDPDVQPTDLRTICVGGLHRSVRLSVVIAGGFPSFGSGARLALPKEAS